MSDMVLLGECGILKKHPDRSFHFAAPRATTVLFEITHHYSWTHNRPRSDWFSSSGLGGATKGVWSGATNVIALASPF